MIKHIATWVKQVVFGAGIVAVLGLFPLGYKYGVDSERIAQRAEYTKELETLVKRYDQTQGILSALAQGQQVSLTLLRTKQDGVKSDVNKYNQSSNARISCLDDEWLRVYNNSITGDKHKSGSKVDGKTTGEVNTGDGSK